MPKRSAFGSSRDPLDVQVSVALRIPKAAHVDPNTKEGEDIMRALANEAIQYRIEHGRDHRNAKTRIIQWRNPARPGKLGDWRPGNQDDAWDTLAQWLAYARVEVVEVRRRR